MTAIEIMNGRPESGGYRVDVSRDGHNGRVSSEWFSRPDDEKYLSLSDLYTSVKGRAARRKTRTVESAAIRVEAHRDDPEKLAFVLPDADAPVAPTHWSFGQLASLVGATLSDPIGWFRVMTRAPAERVSPPPVRARL